jgi:hypothetical protein
MRVKKLIEWLSEDFRPEDEVVVMVWGKELFPHYDHDTDTEVPLTDEQWHEAVEGAKEDRAMGYASETVYDIIREYINVPSQDGVTA